MSRFLASLASVLFALLAWPAHLLAKAGLRFVHAVPGANEAELTIEQAGRTTLVGSAAYAGKTKLKPLESGEIRWKLVSGGDTLAEGTGEVGTGPITAIAMPQGARPVVKFFREAAAPPRGRAAVRVIHAAPELGEPDVRVDGKTVAEKVGFGEATPTQMLRPGKYDLDAVRSGSSDPIVAAEGVAAPADAATTAIVIGTSGEPARILTITDREEGATAKPKRERKANEENQGTATSPGGGSYTIERGDSLWSIAREQLGSGASNARIAREVARLWETNASRIGTGDPNLIFPGQEIRV